MPADSAGLTRRLEHTPSGAARCLLPVVSQPPSLSSPLLKQTHNKPQFLEERSLQVVIVSYADPRPASARARLAACLLPFASRLKDQVTMNFPNETLCACISHFSSLSARGRELS